MPNVYTQRVNVPSLRILAVSNSASAPKMRRWELEIIRENTSIKNTQPMKKSKTSCRGWSLLARLQKTRIWRLCRRLIFENSIPLHYIFTRTAVPFWSPVVVRHHRSYMDHGCDMFHEPCWVSVVPARLSWAGVHYQCSRGGSGFDPRDSEYA